MKFIFLGHACFQIDTGKEKLLFDPFLTGNGLAEEAASKVECDYIFLSHAHADHFGAVSYTHLTLPTILLV